jgi:hypothetical protein
VTVVFSRPGPLGKCIEDDVGSKDGQRLLDSTSSECLEALTHELDVLLRHRPRSIARERRTWITKLRRNPLAEELEDLSHGLHHGTEVPHPGEAGLGADQPTDTER